MSKTKDKIDANAHIKAKLTLDKAKTEKELYTDILDDLERKPLLPYDEYKKIIDSVYFAADTVHNKSFEQAKDVLPLPQNCMIKREMSLELHLTC